MKTLFFGGLARFVMKSILVPFIATLIIAILLLTIDQMLRLFDFVVNENGSITLVWLMLVNLIPEYVAQALPIGFFLGILLAFRRLSVNSEMDVLWGGGASLKQLLAPIFVLGLVLCMVDLVVEGYVQPKAYYRYKQLGYEVRQRLFDAKLHPGEFMRLSDQDVLRFGTLDASGRKGANVFFQSCPDNGKCMAWSAKRGEFINGDSPSQITLQLEDGRQLGNLIDDETPVYFGFKTYHLPITLPSIAAFRARGGVGEEATTLELIEHLARDDVPKDSESWYDYRANLHWRMLNASNFFWLPFLATALGITRKRNQSFTGLVIGMALLITYIEVSQAMMVRSEQGQLPPWEGMWLIYGLYALGSMIIFYLVSERPGGVALSGLRDLIGGIANIAGMLARPLFRRFR